jgi:ADP-ribose diphosphatase
MRARRIPPLPEISLELIEDLSPPAADGFLRLCRRRLALHFPDGEASEQFVYDAVDRAAIDAVVIAAHFSARGARSVYLRSAVRPPVALRDATRSPVDEAAPSSLWELAAGLVEPDEQSEVGLRRCAQRELAEELGFRVEVDALRTLGPSTFPAPGICAERHFFFEVEVDPAARGEPELDGSPLERGGVVCAVTLADALDACRAGAIEDAKTELALRRLAERFP